MLSQCIVKVLVLVIINALITIINMVIRFSLIGGMNIITYVIFMNIRIVTYTAR